MSINLVVSENCYKKDKLDGNKIHYMPCKIKFDGPVKFSKYMKSREASDEKDGKIMVDACMVCQKLQNH
jgi:hypothetical protein